MDDTAIVRELLEGIVTRDTARIAACLSPAARLRALTPHQLREEVGPDAIAAQYGFWLDPLDSFAVTSSDVVQVADRVRLRYRFTGRDPVKGWQENEHTAYATVVDSLIEALNLSCAGFRPAEPR